MSQLTLEQALQLALSHHQAGRLQEAESLYRQILAVQPRQPDALHLLGMIARRAGRLEDATDLIRQAIAILPTNAVYHSNLGNILWDRGQIAEAVDSYQQALAIDPNLVEALNNLGAAWNAKGRFEDAAKCLQRALELNPVYANAHNNLGTTMKDLGQIDQAIACYRQALSLDPANISAHDNLLLALHYQSTSDAQSLFAEHQCWDRRHAEPLQKFILPHTNARDPHRPLRIGYVSPDFRDHPVGRFLLPLLASHNSVSFQTFCYSNVRAPDVMTQKLQNHSHAWQNIFGLPDEQAASLIRQDQIDILVDLAGHTANNRLLLFAHKPAPIQATWLGYPSTTGLSAIDYRLVDAQTDPPDLTDSFNSEKLIRLPDSFLCFQPVTDVPAVSTPPVLAAGHICFGSFNTMAKINEPLLSLWAEILQSIPGSHLLLKNDAAQSLSISQRILSFFAKAGIPPERIRLLHKTSTFADHMKLYQQIDIALDAYPYHGTATTCDALWMGVPVISLAGQSHVSRVGASILTNLGLPELIARTPEKYVQIAADLATNLPRLTELRSTLRDRMLNSPLMDAPRFARDIEQAYRTMWQTWCKNHSIKD